MILVVKSLDIMILLDVLIFIYIIMELPVSTELQELVLIIEYLAPAHWKGFIVYDQL